MAIEKTTLVAAMQDARFIRSYRIDSWAAVSIYFAALDQIGTCYDLKGKVYPDKTNSIYKAIKNFSDLSDNEARAFEALRHAFVHNYSLVNVKEDEKTGKITQNRTHIFTLSPQGELINLPKILWNGKDYLNTTSDNRTRVNIVAFGDLVERIYLKFIDELELGNISNIIAPEVFALKYRIFIN